MKIRPLSDRIAVRPIPVPTHSESGIYLGEAPADDGFVKKTVRGEVLAVGPGKERGEMWGIEIGQIVEYSPVGGNPCEVDGQSFTMIRRDAVVGVVA